MNGPAAFDRILETWLESEATSAPTTLHADVIEHARNTRQRAGWLARLHSTQLVPAFGLGERQKALALGLAVLALVLVLVALAAIGSQRRVPPPFGPAANGALLYERDGDLFITDRADATERPLIIGPDYDLAPLWSRDGTKLAFFRETGPNGPSNVMAADADGSHIRALTTEPLTALDTLDWSPDGTRLVVHHEIGGKGAISILADDGGPMKTLDLGPIDPWGFVAWRPPTGAELIFIGHPGDVESDLAVFRVRPDGTGVRRIALKHGESPGRPGSASNPLQYSFQDMVLSDDGSKATFWNWEPNAVAGRDTAVHVLDLTSGQDRAMVYQPSGDGGEFAPALSPDATMVVFEVGYRTTPTEDQLMVSSVDGTSAPRRIGPAFSWQSPHAFAFSPNGAQVILVVEGQPGRLIDVASGNVEEISASIPGLPSWQRRGD